MGAAMNTNNFLSRLLHSQIARLSIILMLAWSIPAFSSGYSPPPKVPTFSNPIHVAAKTGDLAKVGALLKDSPELVSSRDKGWTPLHDAAEYCFKDIAELLLAHKADVNAKDDKGETPITLARIDMGSFFHVPHDAAWDVVELLRQHGGYNLGPIHDAVLDADLAKAKTAILKNPNQVSIKDRDGDTPLHIAAKYGLKEIAELLLANGAEVDAKDKNGHTPLFLAMRNGYTDVIELLRRHGGHE
jgi:ankyrin repeat protein